MSVEASLRKIIANPDISSLPFLVDALSTTHSPKINTGASACIARLVTSSSPHSVAFVSQLDHLLSGTQLHEWHSALLLLSVLLQAAPNLAVEVLSTNSVLEQLVDGTDILLQISFQSKIKEIKEDDSDNGNKEDALSRTKLSLAVFMSTAASISQARPLIAKLVPVETWLKQVVDQKTTSSYLKAVATIALIKLAMFSKNDNTVNIAAPSSQQPTAKPSDLISHYNSLVDILTSTLSAQETKEQDDNDNDNRTNAGVIEGLSLLSHFPAFKKRIASDPKLLTQIFALAQPSPSSPSTSSSELQYALGTLLHLLTAQKQRFSKEEEAKRHLQKMAARSNGQPQEDEDEESDDDINKRVDTLLDAGILSPLSKLTSSMSVRVRRCVAETLLSLVEKRERRPKIIQDGGANTLMRLISSITIPQKLKQQHQDENNQKSSEEGKAESSFDQLDISPEDLTCIQALCKLAITTNPILLFSDSHRLHSLPRPFSLLILYPQISSLLQQFESLMALTNLASLENNNDNNLKSTIASMPHFMESIQELLLNTTANGMMRRAAAQLACNLVMCRPGFMFWAGSDPLSENEVEESDDKANANKVQDKVITSRLHLLLALCSVNDDDTRIAASGALATLTLSPQVSDVILSFDRASDIIESLLTGDNDNGDELVKMGLKLRGEEIVRNINTRLEQKKQKDSNSEKSNDDDDDVKNLSTWMQMVTLVNE